MRRPKRIRPKASLRGEAVRQAVEHTLGTPLNWAVDGYKGDSRAVVKVLVKAAIERQTIESGCDELALEVSSNPVREQLNVVLDGDDRCEHEGEMNAGRAGNIPEAWPGGGREMGLDWHDEGFYGKTLERRTYACRAAATEGTTYF